MSSVLADAGVRKIVLKRHNPVKSFVSLLLARQTGEWVAYDDAPRPGPRPRIEVDIASMRETIAFNDAYYREIETTLAASGQSHLELFYEELFSRDSLEVTLKFLGLPAGTEVGMAGRSWKLTPASLSEVIANFDEVGTALRGTELEAHLYSQAY